MSLNFAESPVKKILFLAEIQLDSVKFSENQSEPPFSRFTIPKVRYCFLLEIQRKILLGKRLSISLAHLFIILWFWLRGILREREDDLMIRSLSRVLNSRFYSRIKTSLNLVKFGENSAKSYPGCGRKRLKTEFYRVSLAVILYSRSG